MKPKIKLQYIPTLAIKFVVWLIKYSHEMVLNNISNFEISNEYRNTVSADIVDRLWNVNEYRNAASVDVVAWL